MSKVLDRVYDGMSNSLYKLITSIKKAIFITPDSEDQLLDELLETLSEIKPSRVEQALSNMDRHKVIDVEITSLYTHIMYLVEYTSCIKEKRLPSKEFTTIPSAQTITLRELFVSPDGYELYVDNSVLEFKDQCKAFIRSHAGLEAGRDHVGSSLSIMCGLLLKASKNTAAILAEL